MTRIDNLRGKGLMMLGVWLVLAAAVPSNIAQSSAKPNHMERVDAALTKMQEILDAPLPPSSGDVIVSKLGKFRGRSPQYAFDRLGYPDRKMQVGGATVYSWINTDTNLDGGRLVCTIKVVVRTVKIITTDFYGNNGACARFARALDPAFHGQY